MMSTMLRISLIVALLALSFPALAKEPVGKGDGCLKATSCLPESEPVCKVPTSCLPSGPQPPRPRPR